MSRYAGIWVCKISPTQITTTEWRVYTKGGSTLFQSFTSGTLSLPCPYTCLQFSAILSWKGISHWLEVLGELISWLGTAFSFVFRKAESSDYRWQNCSLHSRDGLKLETLAGEDLSLLVVWIDHRNDHGSDLTHIKLGGLCFQLLSFYSVLTTQFRNQKAVVVWTGWTFSHGALC